MPHLVEVLLLQRAEVVLPRKWVTSRRSSTEYGAECNKYGFVIGLFNYGKLLVALAGVMRRSPSQIECDFVRENTCVTACGL